MTGQRTVLDFISFRADPYITPEGWRGANGLWHSGAADLAKKYKVIKSRYDYFATPTCFLLHETLEELMIKMFVF